MSATSTTTLVGQAAVDYAAGHDRPIAYTPRDISLASGRGQPIAQSADWGREFLAARPDDAELISCSLVRADRSELADQIAAQHGCDMAPGAPGRPVIIVQGRHQQGDPLDGRRKQRCREALIAAGIGEAARWLS